MVKIASVFIDLGHGGKDSGSLGKKGQKESDIVLQIGKLVELNLKRSNVTVHMSRQNDTYLTLEERTSKANKLKTNCLVSIHCNSSDTNANGLETFCYKFKYRELADCVHSEIIATKAYTRDRKVKEGNYHMVRESSMSACIVELGFINNDKDIEILETRQKELARGISKGICKYLNVPYSEESCIKEPIYVVATGAFKDVNNAKQNIEELKKKGFKDAYIHIDK